MASLQPQSFGHAIGHAKITKARSRQAVKPILKKLQSHSEKNSLDLDRSWEDQSQFAYTPYSPTGDDDTASPSYGPSYATSGPGYGSRPARDVSFSLSTTEVNVSSARPNKYSHARSTSGTSHASSTSGGRNGSFVHPFQQTPRASTPPLSYANSLASLDNPTSAPRDYSPTITEDDDDLESPSYPAPRNYPPPRSHPHPRRPSLASQRTSSLSDVNQPLRTTINRSSTGGVSKLGHGSLAQSRSDLHLNTAPASVADSSQSGGSPPIGSIASPQPSASATASSPTPLSPLRTSLDMNNFRIRSRSEVDTATRQEQVREARRKFEEKERAKEEKYAREQSRKEAHRLRKSLDHHRKASTGFSSGRNSCSIDVRPSMSRKTTATGVGDSTGEKVDFSSQGYDDVTTSQAPYVRAEAVRFQSTRRKTKRRTTSAWTAFVLWLRTRLLKLGRR